MLYRDKLPEYINLWEIKYENSQTKRIDDISKYPLRWIDTAWAVMLIKQKIIPEKHLSKIIDGILEYWGYKELPSDQFGDLQKHIIKKFGVSVGGSLTIGRTVPPLVQIMPVRHELLKVINVLLDFQDEILKLSGDYLDAVMPGYTHFRHAQPTTFGHYLLSVFDPLLRTFKKIEQGYDDVNLNELGCGALAGTSLPIDRNLVSDYLGLNGLIENCNDAVGFSDGYVSIVSALANFMAIVSRFSLDLNLWSASEYDFIDVPWVTAEMGESHKDGGRGTGHSYFMPNKTSNCPFLERARVGAAEVLGALTEITAMGIRTPHGDNHEMLHMADSTLRAIRSTHLYVHTLIYTLPFIKVFKENMLNKAREGYSAATELANCISMRYELDYRTSHEIVYEFCKESKSKKIPAFKASIEIFQNAAQKVLGRTLDISEETLRENLDPVYFVKVTASQGGVSVKESLRMLNERKEMLKQAVERQDSRIRKLEGARTKLQDDMTELKRIYCV
ncbi:MAG TPA: lyase family protein [Clostridia bacterium]